MRRLLACTLLALAASAPAAHAHPDPRAVGPRATASSDGLTCPESSHAMKPTHTITGSFSSEMQGSYVMVPFTVPDGTRQVRVRYCYDQPESPSSAQFKHTLDLGLWDARSASTWIEDDFRGWGGSSHPDVAVSTRGFKPRVPPAEGSGYPRPASYEPGYTTHGYVPGPVEPGTWGVELGVAAVVSPAEGDLDGVRWRVDVELTSEELPGEDHQPAQYPAQPANDQAGWYAGDLHVHGEHSSLPDAPNGEVFRYAFGKAGLDFITLSDYVTTSGWDAIGEHPTNPYLAVPPGKLVVRSAEVITYKGHLNNHGSLEYVDHRMGPLYHWDAPTRTARRVDRETPVPADAVKQIHQADGWTQINHPTIFPSSVPGMANLCRGCPWDWTAAQTDYGEVDAIEVQTGPAGDPEGNLGPNPFTVTAIDFYERALDRGHHIAAVGVSDSHHAGRTPNRVTQTPVGKATTVVYADELSEEGVERAVQARHTYVKLFGNAGPDLRLEARVPGRDPDAIMGDVVRTGRVDMVGRVTGADPRRGFALLVVRDGVPIQTVPVTQADQSVEFTGTAGHRYRLQLMRNTAIEALTSPIWVDPKANRADRGIPKGAKAATRSPAWVKISRKRTRGATRFTCRAAGYGLTHCLVRAGGKARKLRLRGGRASTTLRVSRRAKGSAMAIGPGLRVGPDR